MCAMGNDLYRICFNRYYCIMCILCVILSLLKEARACDGCYNRARSEIAAHERQKMIANMRKLPANGNSSNGMTSEEYLQNQSRADAESRQQLFSGGNTSAGSNSTGAQMSSSTNETLNALGDAKIQLQQRGEKLKHASDRSAELAEASSEFAKMAKQLKEQNRSWF